MKLPRSIPLGLAAVAIAGLLLAQEHPEHPKGQEHPEHPKGKDTKALDAKAIGKAVRAYVDGDTKLKGGYFLVYDPKAGAPLVLTLDKVHDDKLTSIGGGTYFACADFKAGGGKTYDLDIFLKADKAGDLHPVEITVHKEDGQARYAWEEKGGVWKRKEK